MKFESSYLIITNFLMLIVFIPGRSIKMNFLSDISSRISLRVFSEDALKLSIPNFAPIS